MTIYYYKMYLDSIFCTTLWIINEKRKLFFYILSIWYIENTNVVYFW